MTVEINQAMAQLITKALDGVDSAIDFSKTQLPGVIEQLITWKIAQYCIVSAVCVLSIISMAIIARWLHKKYNHSDKSDSPDLLLPHVLMVVVTVFFAALLLKNSLLLVKINVAPKVWLIEYAAQIVKD